MIHILIKGVFNLKLAFLFVLVIFLLVGCSAEESENSSITTNPDHIGEYEELSSTASLNSDNSVDYDLTVMSSTMVFSQVYDMMVRPTEYLGKTFKAVGMYDAQLVEVFGETCSFIVINDATGCCPQGLIVEFEEGLEAPEIFENFTIKAEYLEGEMADQIYYYLKIYSIEPA